MDRTKNTVISAAFISLFIALLVIALPVMADSIGADMQFINDAKLRVLKNCGSQFDSFGKNIVMPYTLCRNDSFGACNLAKDPSVPKCDEYALNKCRAPVDEYLKTCSGGGEEKPKITNDTPKKQDGGEKINARIGANSARIVSITEDVLVRNYDAKTKKWTKWRDLKTSDTPGEGYEVSTGPLSSVVMEFAEGHRVEIKSLTVIRVGTLLNPKDRVKVQLLLKLGEINARTPQQKVISTDFSIKTPTATMSVRGTDFSVRFDDKKNETFVAVREGKLFVVPENKKLKSVTLSAGKEATITKKTSTGAKPFSKATKKWSKTVQ
ncbi:FecR domain-containing protein [Candidatus Uhrbacteria bacterium]|nr:FecR domain-containing protein [Candidatus Uhrbacteria bacterium]